MLKWSPPVLEAASTVLPSAKQSHIAKDSVDIMARDIDAGTPNPTPAPSLVISLIPATPATSLPSIAPASKICSNKVLYPSFQRTLTYLFQGIILTPDTTTTPVSLCDFTVAHPQSNQTAAASGSEIAPSTLLCFAMGLLLIVVGARVFLPPSALSNSLIKVGENIINPTYDSATEQEVARVHDAVHSQVVTAHEVTPVPIIVAPAHASGTAHVCEDVVEKTEKNAINALVQSWINSGSEEHGGNFFADLCTKYVESVLIKRWLLAAF